MISSVLKPFFLSSLSSRQQKNIIFDNISWEYYFWVRGRLKKKISACKRNKRIDFDILLVLAVFMGYSLRFVAEFSLELTLSWGNGNSKVFIYWGTSKVHVFFVFFTWPIDGLGIKWPYSAQVRCFKQKLKA